jgi:hypothetical protein
MGHWAAAGPNYYATARMHWAPKQTNARQVLAQWSGAFTGATKEISAYIDYWSAFTNATFTSNVTRTRIENLTSAISKHASTSHGW